MQPTKQNQQDNTGNDDNGDNSADSSKFGDTYSNRTTNTRNNGGSSHYQQPHHNSILHSQLANKSSVGDAVARQEVIDSVESADADQAQTTVEVKVANIGGFLRLTYPLSSNFPHLKKSNNKEVDSSDSSDFEDGDGHASSESTPWWQQDVGYYHDYRNHNWGLTAMRALNMEALDEAEDAMKEEKSAQPVYVPQPIPEPDPNELIDHEASSIKIDT